MDTMVPGDFLYEIVNVQAFNERDENVTGTRDFTFQFIIDQFGVVRLNESLDREEVEFFLVEISVSSRSNNDSGYDQAMLRAKIQDVNDNAPVFSDTTLCGFEECYHAVVLEEYTVFQTYSGVKASDPDKGTNGDVEYNILNDTSNVQIDRYTGDITFTSNFDREEYDQINITVRAMDKGLPSLYEDILVIFKVHDINDNEPEFLNLPYTIYIYENATIGEELYNVSAQDLDIGNNSVIEYSIIAGDNTYGFRRFTIDQMGTVRLNAALNRELTDCYDLTIQAIDSPVNSPRLRNFELLRIWVLDINDNHPMFTDYEYTAEVREDESTGKVIAILTAEDADIGENGYVEYSIGNRNDTESGGELFSIRTERGELENSGEVYVSSATLLDRQGIYFLEIIATDRGIPPLSSIEILIVTVHDTNVNAPEFQYIINADDVEQPLSSNFSQYLNVTEDYTGFICRVYAIDGDQGENARVTYLLSESRDYFDIDPNSGIVVISHMTDREVIPSYMFSVIAHDNGTPMQMSTELLITVHVDDINDNPPVFPRNEDGSPRSDTFHVSEAAASGTVVGIVTEASDADIGSNAENYYFLIGGDGHEQFTLNKYTRQLTVKEQLDREEKHLYELVVKADDDENWSGPTSTPSGSYNDTTLNLVKVYIDDVNDNPPRFCQNGTSPTMESRRRRAVDENQDMYKSVGLQNWKDVYFLSRVDEDGKENDPVLLIMDSNYDSVAAKHKIRIRSVSQEVTEVDPTPNVTIPENSAKGTKYPIKNHVVEDPDDLKNGIFSLSVMDEGGQVLDVLPEEVKNIATLITLVVKNSTYLDYEERHHFDIELLAEEIHTDEMFSDVYRLTILLEDENDNWPIFNQTLYEGKVVEHANSGDFVLQVTASDLDSGEYAVITYGLTGKGADKFDMDPQNGTMTVAEGAHFEWETKEVYNLVANATDGGGLTGYTNVTVYVIDTIIKVDMQIMPSSSPIEGNTTVQVTFDTCVKDCKDFKNITVLNITLAEVPCSEWIDRSTNDTVWIECITQRVESTSVGVVRVETDTEVGYRFLLSSTQFYYKNPKITGFNPKIGPQSGGTTVTLQGSHLDAGNMIDVQIGHLPCEVDRDKISDQSIVCNNSRSERLFSSILRVTFDQAIRNSTDKFEYMEDPVVESVVPLRATVAGGSTQVVTGTNLHTIAQPKMSTTTVSKTVYNVLYSDCTVENATHMTCPSPKIPEDAVTLQRRTRNIDQNCEDAIIVVDQNGNEIRFYIGFVMDGVTKWTNLSSTLPEYSQMNITKDPVYDVDTGIRTHNPDETEYLIIKGQGLNCGNTLNDIQVLIGRDNCDTVSLSYEDLVCKPPRTQPPMLNTTNTYPEIIVRVSRRSLFIGFLKYVFTSSKTDWWIYGTIIASVSILLISIMVMVGVYRRRRRLDKERASKNRPVETFLVFEREEDSEAIRSNYLYPSVESGDNARRLLLESLGEEMRGEVESVLIDPETSGMKMKLGKELGSGHFGKVYLSELTDKSNCTTQVAVKVLQKYSPSQSDINDFLLEGTIMKDFQHQNVLNLIGVYIDVYGSPYIIIPYMANGDLRTHISRTDHHFKQAVLIDFGLQVARGMDYLCGKKFVHRDLAARNCMVDGQMVVKVADFGLSRDIYEKEYYVSENKRALPVKWMAPECLSSQHFDTKSDVWSFGVLLWEVMTRGATPYAGIDNLDLTRHLKKGNRLPMPKYLSTKLYNVMRRCWCTSPEHRPTFSELVEDLEEVLLNDEHLDDPASDDIVTKSYVQLIPHRQRDEDDDFSSDEEEFSSGDEWIKMKEMPLEQHAAYLKVRQSIPTNKFDAAMECETLLLHDDNGQEKAKLSQAEIGGVYTKLTTNDPSGFSDIGSEEDMHLNTRNDGLMVPRRGDKLTSSVGEDGYMTKFNMNAVDPASASGGDRYILIERRNANMSMDPRDSHMLERAEDPHATDGGMVKYQKNGTVRKVIDDGYTKLAAGNTQVTKMGGYIPPGATGRYMETFPTDWNVKPAGSRKDMDLRGRHQIQVGSDRHATQESTDGYMDILPRGDHLTLSDSPNYIGLGREQMEKMEPHGHVIQGGTVGYMETFRAGTNSTESTRHDYMPLGGDEVTKMKPYGPNRPMPRETSDGYMETSQVQGDWTTSASHKKTVDGYMETFSTGYHMTSLDGHNYTALQREQVARKESDKPTGQMLGVTDGYMETFPTRAHGHSTEPDSQTYMALGREHRGKLEPNEKHMVQIHNDGYMVTLPPRRSSTSSDSHNYMALGRQQMTKMEPNRHVSREVTDGYMEMLPSDSNSRKSVKRDYMALRRNDERTSRMESGGFMLPGEVSTFEGSIAAESNDMARSSHGYMPVGKESGRYMEISSVGQDDGSSVPSRGNDYVTLGEDEGMKILVKDEDMASGVTNRYTGSHGTGGRQAVIEDESYVESIGRGRDMKTGIEADDYELLKSREHETTETEADDYELLKRTSKKASYGGRGNNTYVCERSGPEADEFMASGRENISIV
ncbi:uncharacterized protein [Ptychodera flava]|uniref:uncharacterized protein n=1 Tax=Ptychodera flava TaxID=63121 RepID=UPI00396A9051